jgi:hypothetical protein
MDFTLSGAWRTVKEGVRWIVVGPRIVAPMGPIPGRKCLAQDYAGCVEFNHCRDCSSLEQILRAVPCVEKNWRRLKDRGDSPSVGE